MRKKQTFVQRSGSPLYVPAGEPEPSPGMRSVYSNDVLVGEVPKTGNDLKDLEAATKLLRAKGHKPPTPLQRMFMVAVSFATAASSLHKTHLMKTPADGNAMVPFVVNSAFSIEIYLKALHASTGPRQSGHRLLVLYDALPQGLKDEIDSAARQHAKAYKIEEPIDFRSHVAHLNRAFERWRYIYEHASLGTINIWPTIFVMNALHDVARARIPRPT